jgi:hypothetical protein
MSPTKTPTKAPTKASDAMDDADFENFTIRAVAAEKMNAKPHKKQRTTYANTPPPRAKTTGALGARRASGTAPLRRCKTGFVDVVVKGVFVEFSNALTSQSRSSRRSKS